MNSFKKYFSIKKKVDKNDYNKIEFNNRKSIDISIWNYNNNSNFKNLNARIRFKVAIITVLSVTYFIQINKELKLYGKSSKLYNFNYKTIKKINKDINFNKNIKLNIINKIPFSIFNPKGRFFILWNIFMIILIIYSLIYLPFGIVFYPDSNDILDYIINSFFVLDIIFNFNTAYINKNKMLEVSRKKIALNYLKTYFFIDLISSIPFELIFSSSNTSANKLIRILKMPRLIRMIKVSKIGFLKKLLENFHEFSYKLKIYMGIINIVKLALFTLLMLHLSACLWAFIGFSNENMTNNWIHRSNIPINDKLNIYIASVYFCFVTLTTVGYGDIKPYNKYEIIFCIFWMMVGVSFYSLIIGLINSFFQNKETVKSLLAKKITTVDNFCKVNKINADLKNRIIKNLKFSSSKISYLWLNKNQSVFDFLNLQLKYEFLKNIYKNLLNHNPFFYEKNISFIVKIVPLLKPIKLEKGEYLWKINEFSNSIIFLTKGEVDFYFSNPIYNLNISKNNKSKNNLLSFYSSLNEEKKKSIINNKLNKSKIVFKTMSNGSYFGEVEIVKDKRRFYDIVAKTKLELFILSRNDFENIIIKEYPQIYNEIINQSNLKHQQNLKFIDLSKDYLLESLNINDNDIQSNLNKIKNMTNENYNLEKYKKMKKIDINKFYKKIKINNCFEDMLSSVSISEDSIYSNDSAEIKTINLKHIVNKWNLSINNLKDKYIDKIVTKNSITRKKISRKNKRLNKNKINIKKRKSIFFNKNYEYIFNNLIDLRGSVNREILVLDDIEYKLKLFWTNN